MREILLFTINAGYVHPAMGLWYLYANLGPLRERATVLEVTRRAGIPQIVSQILAHRPQLLAVSVSIWNHTDTLAVLAAVRHALPQLPIIIGGPEPSHLPADHPLLQLADVVIRGEAELVFPAVAEALLAGRSPAPTRLITAPPPDLAQLELPHRHFTDQDIRRRFIYLEASRGCPFSCEFCLSSLDHRVRHAPLEPLFAGIDELIARGATRFKFIDRTFNLRLDRAAAILEFWLARLEPAPVGHPHATDGAPTAISIQFEMVPDRFPPDLRALIRRFPPGTLRLEVGIQTFNPGVAAAISRAQDYPRTHDSLQFLHSQTNAIVHADLIVGLPGETLSSFAAGFDRLYSYRPAEIQIGILKRLPGAPIARHDPRGMRYQARPPYQVIATDAMDEPTIARLTHLAKYWELVVNRGKMPAAAARLLATPTPFNQFLAFSDFAYARLHRTHAIDPPQLEALIEEFLAR